MRLPSRQLLVLPLLLLVALRKIGIDFGRGRGVGCRKRFVHTPKRATTSAPICTICTRRGTRRSYSCMHILYNGRCVLRVTCKISYRHCSIRHCCANSLPECVPDHKRPRSTSSDKKEKKRNIIKNDAQFRRSNVVRIRNTGSKCLNLNIIICLTLR